MPPIAVVPYTPIMIIGLANNPRTSVQAELAFSHILYHYIFI
jgi:hypothetical protein